MTSSFLLPSSVPCYFLVPFGYTRVKRYQEKKFHAAILTMSVPRLTRYFDLGLNNEIHNFVKIKVIPFPTPHSQSCKLCKALVKTAFRMEGSQRLRATNELPAAILSKRGCGGFPFECLNIIVAYNLANYGTHLKYFPFLPEIFIKRFSWQF